MEENDKSSKRKSLRGAKASFESPKSVEHSFDYPNGAAVYLKRKKVENHGGKFGQVSIWKKSETSSQDENGNWERHDSFIVPIRNIEGELCAIQHITAPGVKRIYGLKRGAFHLIGEIVPDSMIYIAEGYATGARFTRQLASRL